MERKSVRINIYNFIRMSHTEPSRFIWDDFETLRQELLTVKQFGFPGTYALKYDALMEPRYQALLREWLDEGDELSAWWEITRELCDRSGVRFRDSSSAECYDDRVNSAYSIGYTPAERALLVDGYMADFYTVFGFYPKSIGSWVLDSVTMAYAAEKYGVEAFATCRDQIGVDGFTLWGGYPNGAYYPSRRNENIPAQHEQHQIHAPVFRLLGPDPIYNFEAEVREGLQGVYTLEPSWLTGRDPKWIRWFFRCLTEEDAVGLGYAQVGQENNFLWENIRPGLAPQLEELKRLSAEGKLRVETLADTARWFRKTYRVSPPMSFQAGTDWAGELSCQWYACTHYRMGLLGEGGHLRIRDLFVYDEKYPSRYLEGPMKGTKSNFDALPVLYPQLWQKALGKRPWIRLRDADGREPEGEIRFRSLGNLGALAELDTGKEQIRLMMQPEGIRIEGNCSLVMDALPVYTEHGQNRIHMVHKGFSYSLAVARGRILRAGKDGVEIAPEGGALFLKLGEEQTEQGILRPGWGEEPEAETPVSHPKRQLPPAMPEFAPGDSVFAWGERREVRLSSREPGEIRYTLDGSLPGPDSQLYTVPIQLEGDAVICAALFTEDGRSSEARRGTYRFSLKELKLESPTELDIRPVFRGGGMADLLEERRGSLDYLDGAWRGSLQDLDVICTLAEPRRIASIAMGFLSHHRSGIVYPERVELYAGPDREHLEPLEVRQLPQGPRAREIEKLDVTFQVHRSLAAFRIVARRYKKMPQWCAYRGVETVFTMADSLIVTPEESPSEIGTVRNR